MGRYNLNPGLYLTGGYRYLDYQDDAPYRARHVRLGRLLQSRPGLGLLGFGRL